MASVFLSILKQCFTIFCSSDEQKPPQQQHQQQGQNQQGGGAWQTQPQPHPHPQQHPSQSHQAPQQQHHYPPQSPPQSRPPKKYQGRIDANQQNQHNPEYLDLRARARREGDAMARAFDESHRAYENGDGAKAKELSNEGKRHKAEMEKLNDQARDWIYYQNNTDSAPDEVDLHGLYVAEAVEKTEEAIQRAQREGKDHLDIIVGKGLHSQGHVAKIKPAIEDLMRKYELAAHLDPHNEGVLIVSLGAPPTSRERGMGSDEITGRLERDDQCIVM